MGEKEFEQESAPSKFKVEQIELDAIKETANIGTGNASKALSNIFKKRVNITLPDLVIAKLSEIDGIIAGPNEMVVGILSKIKDGMKGNILTIIPIKSALDITKTFAPDHERGSEGLDETDKLLIQKVGVAIYSSYLSSLAKFFQKKITFEPPSVISTYGRTVHDYVLLHFENISEFMVIKVGFKIEDTEIEGEFVLLFTIESISSLLYNIRAFGKPEEKEK
ncbi:hypothetical protein GOV05_01155 [Candidatus Woesearchaeota archaeon]|nr:hypothetical protein [Candidatus Woesearchaeota archaeon]